jgi:DNA-binding transcriptional MerR regulator
METERTYTSQELAMEFNCAQNTVLYWAQRNGVKYIGKGKRKIYIFSFDDKEQFKNRPKPGRRWAKK